MKQLSWYWIVVMAVGPEPVGFALAYACWRKAEYILGNLAATVVIVGTALSPEFIYTVGPGDLMPDDRRYAHRLDVGEGSCERL